MACSTPREVVEAYGARYSAGDADGVADLCVVPIVAIRNGEVVHLPDRAAVVSHLRGLIDGYRSSGVASFELGSLHVQPQGERSCVSTVTWKAVGAGGQVVRERVTSYHLVAGDAGWRILSYTNHEA